MKRYLSPLSPLVVGAVVLSAFVLLQAVPSSAGEFMPVIEPEPLTVEIVDEDKAQSLGMDLAALGTRDVAEWAIYARARELISAGANPNQQNGFMGAGNPLLIFAASEGYANLALLLLRAGAKPETKNDLGRDAYAYARVAARVYHYDEHNRARAWTDVPNPVMELLEMYKQGTLPPPESPGKLPNFIVDAVAAAKCENPFKRL